MRLQHRTRSILVQSILVAFSLALPRLTAQQRTRPNLSSAPTLASMTEAQLGMMERQFVGVAEAMPDDKYSFVPAGADFAGVRSFAQEVGHVATANFVIYSAILGQDPPAGVTVSGAANGPEDLQSKEQIVQYLKDSFTLGHKALATLNNGNALAPLDKLPIAIPSLNTRLALVIFSFSHTSDHYGQIVEYLRMNGIVPPASVGQPPANASTR
jgi:uncharacterized damage-inducible protein DinB